MRYRILLLTLLTVLGLSACNLGRDDGDTNGPQPTPTTIDVGGRPSVTIISPQDGDEFVVNEPILLNVTATDAVGITSVQLYADGQIVRTISSETASGETSKDVLLNYTPRSQGDVTLRVVAYRGRTASEPSEVTVSVRANQAQVTATPQPGNNVPVIDPNDPTCRALVNTNLNFRRGPSTNYEVIRVLAAGEVLPITGRLGDNSWWQLRSGTTIGWVSAPFVTTYGICVAVPVISAPATATPQVQPTATATNTSTPQPTATATATPSKPNLRITNIAGPTTVTIPTGETSVTETYSVSITNQGGPLTTQFSNIAQILPVGDEFDVGVVGSLDTNQSISLSVDVTFTNTGTFSLQFTADSEDDVDESNEVDNSGSRTITVQSE